MSEAPNMHERMAAEQRQQAQFVRLLLAGICAFGIAAVSVRGADAAYVVLGMIGAGALSMWLKERSTQKHWARIDRIIDDMKLEKGGSEAD